MLKKGSQKELFYETAADPFTIYKKAPPVSLPETGGAALSAVFHHNAFHDVCDVLAGIAAAFHPVEDLRPRQDLHRILAVHIKIPHGFGVHPVADLLQAVDLHHAVVEGGGFPEVLEVLHGLF